VSEPEPRPDPDLYELLDRPDLVEPLLIVALDGWIDAGLGAASALEQLLELPGLEVVARFDADTLLDHRSRRPTMHLEDGRAHGLTWPAIELRAGRDIAGNDLLLLSGAEPDHRWRAFADTVVDLALVFDVRLVLGLGAYPAPVPHTRPVRVVSTATTAELAEQIGFLPGRIDVPAGVAAAIEERCAQAGLPAAGLWAQVPHYTAAMPYPAAGAALLAALARVGGLTLEPGALREEAQATHRRIEALIDGNPEHLAMVHQLEGQIDAAQPQEDPGFLMSGDDLAEELERFLRDADG